MKSIIAWSIVSIGTRKAGGKSSIFAKDDHLEA